MMASIVDILENGTILRRGAEAVLVKHPWLDRADAIYKVRVQKHYRHPSIDTRLRMTRTALEARILGTLVERGLPVPGLLDVNLRECYLVMECLPGQQLKVAIPGLGERLHAIFHEVGTHVASMHAAGVVHGDLTTSNIMHDPSSGTLGFIDFGLASFNPSIEEKAVDLHLFKRVITSTHARYFTATFPHFMAGYEARMQALGNASGFAEIARRVDKIESRGRYVDKSERL